MGGIRENPGRIGEVGVVCQAETCIGSTVLLQPM
jgi:hypothetical protein